MRHLQVIERLEEMLRIALEIVREQESILNQHGIETDSGRLEEKRRSFYDNIEKII